jgi:hypothetical protein
VSAVEARPRLRLDRLPDDSRNDLADGEGLVECDGHRCEEVAEDVLRGERHRYSADAQPRQQRRDVEAEILEGEQTDQRPECREVL